MDLVESDKQQGLVVPVWSRYSALLKQAGPNVCCWDLPCLGQDYVSEIFKSDFLLREIFVQFFFFFFIIFVQYNNSAGVVLLPHSPALGLLSVYHFTCSPCGRVGFLQVLRFLPTS